jgi:hypothetical protein
VNDTSAVFITFHYWPSNEIGARRTTALCNALSARNISTTVVSAFDSAQSVRPQSSPDKNLHFEVVPEPRKWFLQFMVRAKSALRPSPQRREASVPSHSPPVPPGAQLQLQSTSPARGGVSTLVLKLLDLVDSHKKWSWRAASAATRIARSTHVDVVCSSGPPMSNHIAAYLVSKRCRIPLIVDLRDPWIFYDGEALMARGFPLKVTRYFERRVLPHAAVITVTADYLAQTLTRVYPQLQGKVHVVRNGYDGVRRLPMQETGHRLSILFAGELYLNRDPFGLLEGVERLLSRDDIDHSKVELVFIGLCESFRGIRLRDWMSGKRCESVTQILPPVRARELEPRIERATLLINFAQGSPMTIPAKTYDHMASGRELLIFCEADSATGKLLNGIAGVSIVDPRDATQIDRALEDCYRRHVIEGKSHVPSDEDAAPFSRSKQSELFVNLVETVCAT